MSLLRAMRRRKRRPLRRRSFPEDGEDDRDDNATIARIHARFTAVPTIPLKPSAAAIRAMMRQVTAQPIVIASD